MRFLTFLKQNQSSDSDMKAFKEWYLASKMAANSPHAGIPQITLFVHLNEAPETIINGFNKWQQAFEK